MMDMSMLSGTGGYSNSSAAESGTGNSSTGSWSGNNPLTDMNNAKNQQMMLVVGGLLVGALIVGLIVK